MINAHKNSKHYDTTHTMTDSDQITIGTLLEKIVAAKEKYEYMTEDRKKKQRKKEVEDMAGGNAICVNSMQSG
uniref:Uncharacterized protein n=1 Tax=Moniliophthora roreri TaxID=221103 RepID=A0A0W0FDR1_MONRR